MPEIAILYDRSETDELGIRLTAEEMGIKLGYMPFHKVSVRLGRTGFSYRSQGKDLTGDLAATRVILNRAQSKNRRLYAATILEAVGKLLVNPYYVEAVCASKIRCIAAFHSKGVRAPVTIYIPCNIKEAKPGGGVVDNTRDVAQLIEDQLGKERVVVKVDGGTHGKGITLVEGRRELEAALRDVTPSVINPSGVVAQEFVPKWFYDLRIIVSKEKGRGFVCAPTAMVRGGFKEFRTNTYLGNMVFRVNLPEVVRREAVKAGEALASGSEVGVIALDAMPFIEDISAYNETELRLRFEALEETFSRVVKAKADPSKKTAFKTYTEKVEEAYGVFMSSEHYQSVQLVIQESLDENAGSLVFHEGNSCPEYWEQTRIVGGINVGELLLRSAVSLLDN